MPDSDLNILAVDTALNADGYMPGLSNPVTKAEVQDIIMSSQFSARERVEKLHEIRRDLVARNTVDMDVGGPDAVTPGVEFEGLIAEIDSGLEKLASEGRGSVDPDVVNHLDTAVDPENL